MEQTGLSAPEPLLHSESVNSQLSQLATLKSILRITTFHGSWSTSTLKEVQLWKKLHTKCSTAPLLNGMSLLNCQTNEKVSPAKSYQQCHGTSKVKCDELLITP